MCYIKIIPSEFQCSCCHQKVVQESKYYVCDGCKDKLKKYERMVEMLRGYLGEDVKITKDDIKAILDWFSAI